MTQSWINPSGSDQVRCQQDFRLTDLVMSGWTREPKPSVLRFAAGSYPSPRPKRGSIPSVVFVPVWSAGFFGEASHSLIWARAYPASFSQTVDVTVLTRLTGLSTAGFKNETTKLVGRFSKFPSWWISFHMVLHVLQSVTFRDIIASSWTKSGPNMLVRCPQLGIVLVWQRMARYGKV